MKLLPILLALCAWTGCGGGDASPACTDLRAIVTDIDETLTTADEEFQSQLVDDTHDPVARAGATELIDAYFDKGYRVLYLTARWEGFSSNTQKSARQLTVEWLERHGYPLDPERTRVVLSQSFTAGEDTAVYKSDAIASLKAQGWDFRYAYGNATTDIDAYAAAGIAKGSTFIIGEHAGASGSTAVPGEGWTEHVASHVTRVEASPCVGAR